MTGKGILSLSSRNFRYAVLSAFLLASMLVASGFAYQGKAHSAAGVNCDNNAVIYCGAGSAGGLLYKYEHGDGHNSGKSIRAIYSAFGISGADMRSMPSGSQSGTVTSGGDVYVGGHLVATGALTAGREYISGSTRHMNDGVTFYTRPPSVSFRETRLQALVVMQGGTFRFAILTSCGNPVIASPRQHHAPPKPHHVGISPNRPVSRPPKHVPKTIPAPSTTNSVNVCNGDTTNTNSGVASQGGNCSTNTTTNTTNTNVNNTTVVRSSTRRQPPPAPPPPTPPPATIPSAPAQTSSAPTTVSSAPATTPVELPNTGPGGGILGIFGVTTAIGTIGYRLFLVRRIGRME